MLLHGRDTLRCLSQPRCINGYRRTDPIHGRVEILCVSIRRLSGYFFRSKRVILSLALKERGIHACLVCLLWQIQFSDRRRPDNFFRSKRVILSLTLKERGIHIWLVCCGSIRRLIISFAPNGSYCRSRLKNEVYMHVWFVSVVADAIFRSYTDRKLRLRSEVYMHVWFVCCPEAIFRTYADRKLRLRSVQTVRIDKPL